jgi:hypothetical protein
VGGVVTKVLPFRACLEQMDPRMVLGVTLVISLIPLFQNFLALIIQVAIPLLSIYKHLLSKDPRDKESLLHSVTVLFFIHLMQTIYCYFLDSLPPIFVIVSNWTYILFGGCMHFYPGFCKELMRDQFEYLTRSITRDQNQTIDSRFIPKKTLSESDENDDF